MANWINTDQRGVGAFTQFRWLYSKQTLAENLSRRSRLASVLFHRRPHAVISVGFLADTFSLRTIFFHRLCGFPFPPRRLRQERRCAAVQTSRQVGPQAERVPPRQEGGAQ